jgi:hypothetical protein
LSVGSKYFPPLSDEDVGLRNEPAEAAASPVFLPFVAPDVSWWQPVSKQRFSDIWKYRYNEATYNEGLGGNDFERAALRSLGIPKFRGEPFNSADRNVKLRENVGVIPDGVRDVRMTRQHQDGMVIMPEIVDIPQGLFVEAKCNWGRLIVPGAREIRDAVHLYSNRHQVRGELEILGRNGVARAANVPTIMLFITPSDVGIGQDVLAYAWRHRVLVYQAFMFENPEKTQRFGLNLRVGPPVLVNDGLLTVFPGLKRPRVYPGGGSPVMLRNH